MTTTARVQVTIDITVPSTWGDDTTVAQVRNQASEDALGMLRHVEAKYDIKVIGKPTVTAVTTQKI